MSDRSKTYRRPVGMSRAWFLAGYALLILALTIIAAGILLSGFGGKDVYILIGTAWSAVGGFFGTKIVLTLREEGWWTA